MTKATISDAVRVLLGKQLVEKRPSTADGRAFAIALTSEGRATVARTQHFAQPIKDRLQTLAPEDQLQLFTQLSKLIYELNRAGILTVQRTCRACKFYEKKLEHHFCNLLKKELWDQDIRVDCPEYEPHPRGSES